MRAASIFGSRRSKRSLRSRRVLRLEPLERREVMSVSLALSGSVLNIVGDARNDTVELYELPSSPTYPVADLLLVAWKDDLGNGGSGAFAAAGLTKIVFQGNAGNDVLKNVYNPGGAPTFVNPYYSPSVPMLTSLLPAIEAHGGAGNDVLYGGPKGDWLYGEDGIDNLFGNYGNDLLDGGRHDDVLAGGAGDDRYDFNNLAAGGGSLGFDTVNEAVNAGTDTLYFFGQMNRAVNVNLGTTSPWAVNEFLTLKLSGTAVIENVEGTYYNDVIRGNALDNYFYASDGNDTLYGMAGNDTLDGSFHDDTLYGGPGLDTLYGGDGNDTFVSIDSATNDKLYGGGGNDSFWIDSNTSGSCDTVYDASSFEMASNYHAVQSFANGADKTLDGDAIADPTDGINYKKFASSPLFATAGPTELDVDQGSLGDCWLMAAMGAVARTNQNTVRQTVVDLGDGTYAVRLGGSKYYRVDADLPTLSATSWTPSYAGLGVQGSLWCALVEKAYTYYRTGANTYASIAGGVGAQGLPGLNATGVGEKYFSTYANGQAILNDIASKLSAGKALTCGFDKVSTGAPVIAGHEYTVIGVNRDAANNVISVTLRNPHGPSGSAAAVTVTGAQLFAYVGSIAWGSVG